MCTQTRAAGGPGVVSEAALFLRAQAGCSDSLDELMTRHDGLVQVVVRRQVLGDMPFAEALQAGRIGLWRAILGFDPARCLAFSTYAWTAITRHVWRAANEYSRFYSPPIANQVCSGEIADPALIWESLVTRQVLDDLVRHLEPRLQKVVAARYGLWGNPPAFYHQIGTALGVSGERARQLHTEALVWLRHPAHSYVLRSLLGYHTLDDYYVSAELTRRWLWWRGGRRGR